MLCLCVSMCLCCDRRRHALDLFACQTASTATRSHSQSLSVSPIVRRHRKIEQEEQRKRTMVSKYLYAGDLVCGYMGTSVSGKQMSDRVGKWTYLCV